MTTNKEINEFFSKSRGTNLEEILNKKLENASRIIDLAGNNRILNIIENE